LATDDAVVGIVFDGPDERILCDNIDVVTRPEVQADIFPTEIKEHFLVRRDDIGVSDARSDFEDFARRPFVYDMPI
jgi:hypothetical protein